jgi:branched-subunit amino acid transport protein
MALPEVLRIGLLYVSYRNLAALGITSFFTKPMKLKVYYKVGYALITVTETSTLTSEN